MDKRIEEFDKLVRDNIIKIIESKGDVPIYYICEQSKILHYLKKKLLEEIDEFFEAYKKEELADIFEVLEAFMHELNYAELDIESIKEEKKILNGAFSKRIILEKVERNMKQEL